MSNRYDIYCVNCGTQVKRMRISSEKEDLVEIDCPNCHLLSTVSTNDDENVNQTLVEISADEKTIWKNINSNLEPIFTCPICGRFGLTEPKNENVDYYQCKGTNCKRIAEITYT